VSSNPAAFTQKRRSSRVDKAITLAVQGVDVLRAPYLEEVTTGTISCHGCAYQMKHEVLPGEVVFLNVGQSEEGSSEFTARARVKWIQKLDSAHDQAFNVGVELETAGNIWGLASPPEDWFPGQTARPRKSASHGRELRVVGPAELQTVPARSEGVAVPHANRGDAAAALSPWFSDLMGGLSNQIRGTVYEIAASTLANERKRLLDEFRVQLQNEAAGTIERVIATSKDELTQRALKVLNEGAEATVQTSRNSLVAAIERDIENASQQITSQGDELSQRIASTASGTVERLQRTFEASRAEATERFVSRLREQIVPVLEEARADLNKLVVSQTALKEESQAICKQVADQLESTASARLQETHDKLDKHSAAVVNDCNEKLLELSHTFEKIARDSAQAMIASATDDAKKNLEDRAAEISGNFTGQLEGHIRTYLEFIGESIAEFPKKTPAA
jgi:PilZ domain-containing protein